MSLPAVILVGGQGTRLRPLTERIRKDMLPLVDRPLLAFTFEHLRRHGVRRGIVSCGYLPTQIAEHFGATYGDLDLEYCIEEQPLGTAGGIALAARDVGSTFFALNGDSLREADLAQLVDFHRATGARATILLHIRGIRGSVRWFNPRDGQWVERSPRGVLTPPDDEDWVLVVKP